MNSHLETTAVSDTSNNINADNNTMTKSLPPESDTEDHVTQIHWRSQRAARVVRAPYSGLAEIN